MMSFFAYLKRMFAVDKAYQVLTEVIYNAIREIYIPALQKKAEMTKNVADRDNIYALIEQYKKYANLHMAEGRELLEVTGRVVGLEASKYRLSGVVAEDVIQQIAGDFYANASMEKTLKDFNPADGPIGLRNYWSRILRLRSMYRFDAEYKKLIRKDQGQKDEEGNDVDPLENIADPKNQDTEELLKDMIEYIPKNLHRFVKEKWQGEIAMEIYDILKNDMSKIGDYFRRGKDMYPIWAKINKKNGRTTAEKSFGVAWKIIRDIIHEHLSNVAKERKYSIAAGKTAAERVAKEIFRVRMAKWILGE